MFLIVFLNTLFKRLSFYYPIGLFFFSTQSKISAALVRCRSFQTTTALHCFVEAILVTHSASSKEKSRSKKLDESAEKRQASTSTSKHSFVNGSRSLKIENKGKNTKTNFFLTEFGVFCPIAACHCCLKARFPAVCCVQIISVALRFFAFALLRSARRCSNCLVCAQEDKHLEITMHCFTGYFPVVEKTVPFLTILLRV